MALNASVLLLVGVLVRLASSFIALLAWYNHRQVVCLLGWSAAMALSATAKIIGFWRTPGTMLPLTLLSNIVFVAGYTLMWTSMRRFSDARLTLGRQALIVLAVCGGFALLFILAWQAGAPRRMQSALFALFIAGLTLTAAWETWRGYRRDGLRTRHIAAGALVCIAATRLVRLGFLILQSADVVSPQTAELASSYALYLNIFFLLVATTGLVLMAQERADRGERTGRYDSSPRTTPNVGSTRPAGTRS
ncbi:hypothetical protein [Reyranella sp.]|uniref:hypothetical protein n=1 Tax=Reyranella sp. TaxID=1929291 RepID=UPI00273109A7|nr:hypothetical protein [Reyranella sp.]MDP2372450.1 hypothetical protein [Reyranella sp.]